MTGWLTNNPIVARKLKAADRAYNKAREAAKGLPLAQKVEAFRLATAARDDAYEAVTAEFA